MFHWQGIALFNEDREYEEREKVRKNGDVWKVHWRYVANNPQTGNFEKPVILSRQERLAKKRREKMEKLRQEKRERIERYAQMASLNMEIQPTTEDITSAMNLQDMIGRKMKTLPNQVLASMAEFAAQKNEDCGIEHTAEWYPSKNNEQFIEFAKNGGVMYKGQSFQFWGYLRMALLLGALIFENGRI